MPQSRVFSFRNRMGKRLCPCTTAAEADPGRTIRTSGGESRRRESRKTENSASRTRRRAALRGSAPAGGRGTFPGCPQSSDTTASLPDFADDIHRCQSIAMHMNERQRTQPDRCKSGTGSPPHELEVGIFSRTFERVAPSRDFQRNF